MNREMFYTENDVKRFLKYVKKSDCQSCWNWIGCKNKSGYGQFKMNKKQIGAHRLSYSIYKGEIKYGLFVMHTCDNPSCVNPNHLMVGTPLDNVKDRDNKGRCVHIFGDAVSNKGSKNGNSKLDEEKIFDIIYDYSNTNKTIAKIALTYGVGESTIMSIISGNTWNYLEKDLIKRRNSKANYEMAQLIRNIYKLKRHTMKDISKIFGISYTAVNDIINCRRWNDK